MLVVFKGSGFYILDVLTHNDDELTRLFMKMNPACKINKSS